MEKLFNYISYLTTYFNLLVETEDAAQLMKHEIKSETYQRDRCVQLRNLCVKAYTLICQNFDQKLIEIGTAVTVEISKRDSKGQDLLYAQIFDIINEFGKKFNGINIRQGFSQELIGAQFKTILVETADGRMEENQIEYNFSLAMLADDISNKFNELQTLINDRFKFLELNKETETKKTKLTAPAVALFCQLINDTEVIKKDNAQNIAEYCKGVCGSFDLPYTERVRKSFYEKETTKNIKKIRELIFPSLDEITIASITDNLNKKKAAKTKVFV